MSDLIFDTATLNRVVRQLPEPKTGLLGRYFPRIIESATDQIHFDVEGTDLRMTPFCSPLVEAPIMQKRGFETKVFTPAYLKEKTPFTPRGFNQRMMGEPIGGELTPAQRMKKAVGQDLADKKQRLDRRLEWMASQVILNGKIVVAGEKYQATEVDFGRAATLTKTLAAGSKWGETGIKPLQQLIEWTEASDLDAPITDWYFGKTAYASFRADAEVLKEMEMVKSDATFQPNAVTSRQPQFMGDIRSLRIHVMPRQRVQHEDGTITELFPENAVLGVASAYYEGVQQYGAIKDVRAIEQGAVSGKYYAKSWINEDPSVRFMMLQSAPLMVPYRPNTSMRVNVL